MRTMRGRTAMWSFVVTGVVLMAWFVGGFLLASTTLEARSRMQERAERVPARVSAAPAHAWKILWRADQDLNAIVSIDEDTLLLVGNKGVSYRTQNGGDTWRYAQVADKDVLDAVFVDAQKGWLVGRQGLILHTTNGGRTWRYQSSGTNRDLHAAWFTSATDGVIAGQGGLVLYTTDGGATWQTGDSGVSTALYDLWFVNDQQGWAVGHNGVILATQDGGRTWSTVRTGGYALRGVAFAADGQTGYAVGDGGLILRTTDGGQTWAPVASPTTVQLNAVAFTADGQAWIVGNQGVVLREGTAGAFEEVTPAASSHLLDVLVDPRGRVWAVGQAAQAIRSDDGGQTWTQPTGGGIQELWDVSFVDAKRGWVVGQKVPDQDLYPDAEYRGIVLYTEDGGQTWAPQTLPPPRVGDVLEMMGIAFANAQQGVIVGRLGRVYRTDDGGQTWEPIPPNPPEARWMTRVDLQPNGVGWAGGQSGRVWQTLDYGRSWQYRCFNWYEPSCYSKPSFAIPIYGVATQGDRAWFVGRGTGGGHILYTPDNGESWDKMTLVAGRGGSHLWNIFFLDENIGWAVGVTGIIWFTESGGLSEADWTLLPLDPQLALTDIFDVAFISRKEGYLAGGDCEEQQHGEACDLFLPVDPYDGAVVGRTTDGGRTWTVERFPSIPTLYAVDAVEGGAAWAVGPGGVILGYAGPPNSLNALQLAAPLNVDGFLGEWPVPAAVTVTATTADLVLGDFLPDAADLKAQVRALWDTNGLYLGIQVWDDRRFSPESPLLGDAVILGLDGEGDQQGGGAGDRVYTVTLDAQVWENNLPTTDVDAAVTLREDGYVVEMFLPNDVLGLPLADGRTVGFSLALQDNDGTPTPETLLIADSEDYTQPSAEFGRIHIIGDTLLLQGEGVVDTYINRYLPNDNYSQGDETPPPIGPLPWLRLKATSQFDVKSILFRFDLSLLPSTARIAEAELTLRSGTCPYAACATPLTVGAYRILRPWDPEVLNWYVAAKGPDGEDLRWERPGANGASDRESEPEDSQVIPRSFVDVTWRIPRMVQTWVSDPDANFGVMLRPDAGSVEYRLPSTEYKQNPDLRPKLRVRYELLPLPVTPTPTPSPTPTPTPSPTPSPSPRRPRHRFRHRSSSSCPCSCTRNRTFDNRPLAVLNRHTGLFRHVGTAHPPGTRTKRE